ncbi:hypothetical protein [Saccharomonospora saliphila]|uniref:hypothetical protein n=1 Tax=Saccharomonospora saliphila TaxID=369829 RepID=UPI000367E2E2|nr:hypothetical protein [Saccharomonospora saliphila]
MPLVPDPGQGRTDEATTSSLFGFSVTESVSATNTEDVTKTQVETRKLLEAANSGGFRISPEGVEPLKKALINMQERLDRISATSGYALGQRPRLGSHEYGRMVAAHDQKSGSGENNSANAVIHKLRKIIAEADEALTAALKNYHDHESETTQHLKNTGL